MKLFVEYYRPYPETLFVQIYTKPFSEELLEKLVQYVFPNDSSQYRYTEGPILVTDASYYDKIHEWILTLGRQSLNIPPPKIVKYIQNTPPLTLLKCPPEHEIAVLKPHQNDSVYTVIQSRLKRVLLALDQGLGKSLVSLSIMRQWVPNGRVLIICPATLRENWKHEIEKWFGVADISIRILDKVKDVTPGDFSSNFTICSYTFIRIVMKRMGDKFPVHGGIIVDEAHNIKTYSSDQTKAVRKAIEKSLHTLLLTGTPIPNCHVEAYTPLHVLVGKQHFLSCTDFKKRYCDYKFDMFLGQHTARGSECSAELSLLLHTRMIRILKSQVMDTLPKKLRYQVRIENDDQTVKNLSKLIAQGDHSASTISECLQEIGRVKIHSTILYILEYLVQHPNVTHTVVFYYHKHVGNELFNNLEGVRPCTIRIDGETPTHKRQGMIDSFLESPGGIALLTIGTCNTGLNMPTIKTVFFAELDFVPAKLIQCEDRFHRLTSVGSDVNYYYLILQDSADDRILRILDKKMRIVKELHSVECTKRRRIDAGEILGHTNG